MASKKTTGEKCIDRLKSYVGDHLANGGSIYQMAKDCDVHPQTISNLVEDKSNPFKRWDQIEKYMDKNPIK